MSKRLPDKVLQELRCLLAVEGREMTMGKEGEGMKGKEQDRHIERTFHGSHGYASIIDKFLDAKHPYDECFNKLPLENNREGNDQRKDGFMYELKELLHCDPSEYKCAVRNLALFVFFTNAIQPLASCCTRMGLHVKLW